MLLRSFRVDTPERHNRHPPPPTDPDPTLLAAQPPAPVRPRLPPPPRRRPDPIPTPTPTPTPTPLRLRPRLPPDPIPAAQRLSPLPLLRPANRTRGSPGRHLPLRTLPSPRLHPSAPPPKPTRGAPSSFAFFSTLRQSRRPGPQARCAPSAPTSRASFGVSVDHERGPDGARDYPQLACEDAKAHPRPCLVAQLDGEPPRGHRRSSGLHTPDDGVVAVRRVGHQHDARCDHPSRPPPLRRVVDSRRGAAIGRSVRPAPAASASRAARAQRLDG